MLPLLLLLASTATPTVGTACTRNEFHRSLVWYEPNTQKNCAFAQQDPVTGKWSVGLRAGQNASADTVDAAIFWVESQPYITTP